MKVTKPLKENILLRISTKLAETLESQRNDKGKLNKTKEINKALEFGLSTKIVDNQIKNLVDKQDGLDILENLIDLEKVVLGFLVSMEEMKIKSKEQLDIIHSMQHYSPELETFELSEIKKNLDITMQKTSELE